MVETYGFHTGHNEKPSGIKAEIQTLKLVTLNCGRELSHSVVKNFAYPLIDQTFLPTFYEILPGIKGIGCRHKIKG